MSCWSFRLRNYLVGVIVLGVLLRHFFHLGVTPYQSLWLSLVPSHSQSKLQSEALGTPYSASFLTLAVIVLLGVAHESVGSGNSRGTAQICPHCIDRVSGRPIGEAVIRLRDISGTARDFPPVAIPNGEPGVQASSDAGGFATLFYSLPNTSRYGPLMREEKIIFTASLWIDISANGYEPILAPLRDYSGHYATVDGGPIPVIRIPLSRRN